MEEIDGIIIPVKSEGVVIVAKVKGHHYILTCSAYPGFKAELPRGTPKDEIEIRAYEKLAEHWKEQMKLKYGFKPPKPDGPRRFGSGVEHRQRVHARRHRQG